MKTKVTLLAMGLSLKEQEGKEGRKFYQLSIDQDGEAGSLPMTAECYENTKALFKKYTPCVLTCEFNDQYNSMRIIGYQANSR